MAEFNYQVGFLTDVGMKRSANQDNGGAFLDIGLFVVADGMGGHQGGETASRIVLDVLPEFVLHAQKKKTWNPRAVLVSGIETANHQIYQKAKDNPELLGMGTTTTAILIRDGKVIIGHVDDSRAYLLRHHCLWQLTRDHSLVEEKIRAGMITRSQRRTDKMKNVITRSVGFDPGVNVEIYEYEGASGDAFLMCSDGLSGMVEDDSIGKIADQWIFERKDPQECAVQLIQAANQSGGDDNVTALIVQLQAQS